MLLDWYTTLLTLNQAIAVWIVTIVALTIGYWIAFRLDEPHLDNGPLALFLAAFTYPVLYWAGWLILGLFDVIGWLWTH